MLCKPVIQRSISSLQFGGIYMDTKHLKSDFWRTPGTGKGLWVQFYADCPDNGRFNCRPLMW